ncbi:ribonuclease Z [Methanocalculus chunghsingensis]|uniref:Ribonuclease Z n=1 Tax=Methanocalculus chunghsingensis TaxID=156457 RepID=A0A8J7W6S8_9EURY|nr:ribonuclease Z [Methanocalculus chunghsingensis]
MAGETLHIHFLGTAGALPTPQRNPSCIMIRRGSDTILFDCGEGAQQQMMRARTGFTVDAIFISHWHADHYLGLFGLIETMGFNGRTEPLRLYGPRRIFEFLSIIRQMNQNISFPIEAMELSDGDEIQFDGYRVIAFGTRHGCESYGFILREDDRPGRFDREEAIALGIPPGPLFGRLQRGEEVTVSVDDVATIIRPDQVMGTSRPGRIVVYTSDTRPLIRWPNAARDADLLIHDATFDDAEEKRAGEVYHSTAGGAGRAAAEIGAARLALVHISSRYTSTVSHIQDAERQYTGEVLFPQDCSMIEIPFRD